VLGLDVRITDFEQGTTSYARFDSFPVRIGRNELNQIKLHSPYVSQFHAVVDLDGKRLYIMDLGSRNGTDLGHGRGAPANTFVDLAESGYQFKIGGLLFQVGVFTLEGAPGSRRKGGVHDLAEEMTHTEISNISFFAAQLGSSYKAYRQSWDRVFAEIQTQFCTLDPQRQAEYCKEIRASYPQIGEEADFNRLAGVNAASAQAQPLSPDSSRHADVVAAESLRRLATWYLPGTPPPYNVDEILGFSRAIQDTLDVFFKCFVPLRDAYKQFEIQMDIRRGRAEAPSRVETAMDAPQLARALLEWRTAEGSEQRSVENAFAAIMTHQLAILNGVMKGVKSLLSELSPEAIENETRTRQGLQIGPFRFKQLWEQYVKTFGDLSAEDQVTYSLIFGSQFAQAYTEFAGTVAKTQGFVNTKPYQTLAPPNATGPAEPPGGSPVPAAGAPPPKSPPR
jgi:type VI secretion system protein ImpI